MIELRRLEGEDTSDLEVELRKREDSKARAIIKAEQEERLKLMQKEQSRELMSTPGSMTSPRSESSIPIASATFAQSPVQEATPIESTPEAQEILGSYRRYMERMLKSLYHKGEFDTRSDQHYPEANYVNAIMKTLNKNAISLTNKYCSISFNQLVLGINITTHDKKRFGLEWIRYAFDI